MIGHIRTAEDGGIGHDLAVGFGNLAGVVRCDSVAGGIAAGDGAGIAGGGGIAHHHILTLHIRGIGPLHIRQRQRPTALCHRLGNQGQVRVGQVGIGPAGGEVPGGGLVALDLRLDAVVVQLQHSGIAVLRLRLDLRGKLLQNLPQIAGGAVRGDGLGQGLGLHADLILPGHFHQVEGPAVFLKILCGNTGGIV